MMSEIASASGYAGPTTRRSVAITVHVTEEMRCWIEAQAKARGVSFSRFVTDQIRRPPPTGDTK